MEDINASVYLVKCDNVLNRASHKQGEKQTTMTKFCNGICLFFVLMCVIWAPMLVRDSLLMALLYDKVLTRGHKANQMEKVALPIHFSFSV